jgi:hypothetical protein
MKSGKRERTNYARHQRTIKQLEAGTKGLSTEGTVVYSKERKHIVGEKNGRPYDFYAQFIIVEDINKNSIVVDLNDSREVKNGDFIKLCKGMLKPHTDKEGNPTVKLQAQIIQQQAPQSTAQRPPQGTKAPNNVDSTQIRRDAILGLMQHNARVFGYDTLFDAGLLSTWIEKGEIPLAMQKQKMQDIEHPTNSELGAGMQNFDEFQQEHPVQDDDIPI